MVLRVRAATDRNPPTLGGGGGQKFPIQPLTPAFTQNHLPSPFLRLIPLTRTRGNKKTALRRLERGKRESQENSENHVLYRYNLPALLKPRVRSR